MNTRATSGVLVNVGAPLPTYTVTSVDPENMKLWAGFLRDPNPIHLDQRAVRAKGLGDKVINQGPANLSYLITMLQQAFPHAVLESLEVRYAGMVHAGDAVEASGRIREVVVSGFQSRVTCDISLRANSREGVLSGVAVLSWVAPVTA